MATKRPIDHHDYATTSTSATKALANMMVQLQEMNLKTASISKFIEKQIGFQPSSIQPINSPKLPRGTASQKTNKIAMSTTSRPASTDKWNLDELYCYCGRPPFGKMIKCDGKDCFFEWFHYECVGVKRNRKREWFCEECKIETVPRIKKTSKKRTSKPHSRLMSQ